MLIELIGSALLVLSVLVLVQCGKAGYRSWQFRRYFPKPHYGERYGSARQNYKVVRP